MDNTTENKSSWARDFYANHRPHFVPLENLQPAKQKLQHGAKRTFAFISGAFALTLVTVSAIGAIFFAATHHVETLKNLASSTLTGVGMAIGGCLGSALILRFKAARQYLRSILRDLQ